MALKNRSTRKFKNQLFCRSLSLFLTAGLASFLAFHGTSYANTNSTWTASSRLIDSALSPGIMVTELIFRKGSSSFIYVPGDPPFGLSQIKKIQQQDSVYFVSTWAYGARSTMIRVFKPQTHGSKPICAPNQEGEPMVTFSDEPQTRFRNGMLQILLFDSSGRAKWETCTQTPRDTEVNQEKAPSDTSSIKESQP